MSRFLSTPSGWRATVPVWETLSTLLYFYPRPPGGGRQFYNAYCDKHYEFLSTPSGWRATVLPAATASADQFLSTPSGWRATATQADINRFFPFLSTPSGWRATLGKEIKAEKAAEFLSTPSGWRATLYQLHDHADREISIHALRVEGDPGRRAALCPKSRFLSTPSGWRATHACSQLPVKMPYFYPRPPGGGRPARIRAAQGHGNFYPRPPGGGRLVPESWLLEVARDISIHALRVEGDSGSNVPANYRVEFLSTPSGWRATYRYIFSAIMSRFLSTPSGWRATAKTDKIFVCFCAKGRRICLFKTRKERICRWRFKKNKF